MIELKKTAPLLLITLTLHCFALLPQAPAVVPPPDGGYPGFNTAEGQNALFSLTTGSANTAVGWFSLSSSSTGSFNTATGAGSLLFNTADENTAFGAGALVFNTIGIQNTAVGAAALLNNTTGSSNTAVGDSALFSNTTGTGNVANGFYALFSNTTGNFNTAVGDLALELNTEGSSNTANGFGALGSNTTGFGNTAIGSGAGSNVTGIGNVCIGSGVPGVAGVNSTTWIRNVYTSVVSGLSVYVDSNDKIGTLASSRRYKDEITPMAKASEAILSLRPVSFRYKKEVDPTRSLSFGLIAEEVAAANPDLVVRNKDGEIYTVRYEAVNAMLLNEFLKEHRNGEEQDLAIIQLQSTLVQQKKRFESKLAQQEEQITALMAHLQKLAADIELNKAESRAVAEK